ncbi:MAG TPA: ABC transporter permease [Opitutaceae bacterium]|nr:ABC transporter permease [Opitutaceae bacterium]
MSAPRASTDNSAGAKRDPRGIGWLLLTPLLGWLGLFVVLPTAILFVYSFCQRDELGQVVFSFTWSNYARIFDPVYLGIFGRSLWYAGLTTALCLAIGYPVAYFIGRSPPSRRSTLLLLVMIPFWISFLLRTYAWISLLKGEGLISSLLQGMRLLTGPLDILYTPTAVIIGLVYTYLPFMILPIFTSAEKLDNSMIEAALDLGATPVRAFTQVILPLTKPGIFAGVLLVFVPSIGMFAVTDLMGGARVPMIGNVIQNQFGQARDWPFGAALGITFLALFAITFWFLHDRGEVRR